ncbi:neutral zinc metallopeptidase [Nonomuraea sp. NPDC050310]|uniref:neutral zinc metallopeptidase n=1 Tax=Nonomuraea sp. NPDC050310 TaxID=3154935 RepID=UPI00340A7151
MPPHGAPHPGPAGPQYPQGRPYPPAGPQGQPYPQGAPHPQGQPYQQGRPYQQGQPYGGQYPGPQGGPGWAPPPPPVPPRPHGGQWPPQPQRKRGGGAMTVLGVVLGSLAAVFILLVVATNVLKSPSKTSTTTPIALPDPDETRPAIRPTRRPTLPPVQRPTNRPTSRPTSQPTSQPTQQTPEEEQGEQREEVPRPRPVDTSVRTNSLYRSVALPRLNCPAGNPSIFNHSQLKALILKTGRCMDKAWAPVLDRVGIEWSPPGYAIASGRGRGACGDYPSAGSMVPYYCPRNNTIYASTSAMARGNGNSIGYGQIISWHGGIISMMAHEYGHHVQNLTGILDSYWQRHQATGSESARLALSRRLELQANCFGGMWMRSVAGSYPVPTGRRAELFAFYGRVGDHPGYPRDHGSLTNSQRWFRQGWERSKPQQCNTWMASASATS